ncbi:hypothetical protein [Amycolatopsis australiensis]|uniref:Uncharacterized protein n=1 Tax=Amycolatopsis australiensis TaxID=546364 RepID=A0A1K1LKJ0_9PSEU|nr:hypothetical protein [Amycolatopsis australiensis]SFW11400.1 hypothetical protein SAMN04489730_0010 [Amycolatopsis australiensis]SFW12068.1 hypothetical protein SAMN04489730_0085 [Amycolatopsis australiensis]
MTTPTALIGRAGAAVLAAAALAACQPGHAATTTTAAAGSTAGAPATALANAPVPAASSCTLGHHNGQDLPDPHCTPGTVNPQVTQATIGTTICASGWTKTIRPPTSVTNKLKKQIDAAYGLPTSTEGELDHLISLELGGAPSDPANLWVEPGKIPNPKDAVENKLHSAVCSGLVPLATAQRAIAADWTTAFDDAGLRVAGGKVCLRDNPSRCVGSQRGDEDGN